MEDIVKIVIPWIMLAGVSVVSFCQMRSSNEAMHLWFMDRGQAAQVLVWKKFTGG